MPSITARANVPVPVNDTLPVPADFPALTEGLTAFFKKFNVKDYQSYQDNINDFWTKTKKALIGMNESVVSTAQTTQAVSRNIKLSADGFTAAITEERIARITADGALASVINSVQVAYQAADADLSASVTNEQTARVTADTALATDILTLNATVTTNYATLNSSIITEQNARVTADMALADSITSLTATVSSGDTTLTALITAEQTARVTADTAITSSITTLTATVATNNTTLTAAVNTETTARIDADGVLSGRIDVLTADAGIHSFTGPTTPTASGTGDVWYKTSSGIVHVYRWDGSTWVDQMGADTDALNAAVITEQSARVTADGFLSSKYTLSVIAGNIVTGMNITSSTTGGTNISSIIFQAGDFQIYNGTTGVAPFQVSGGAVRITGSLVITAADVGAIATGTAAADVNTGSTTISGSKITTSTVTLSQLNFVPATSSTIVSTINASTEGILISGSKIHIDGSVTFTSGYDPSTKITTGGAAADVNAGVTTINGGSITSGSITSTQIGTQLIITTSANIGSAVIAGANIHDLDVTKLNAGTMTVAVEFTSARITGGIISTIANRFNVANPLNEMPFTARAQADLIDSNGGNIDPTNTSTTGTEFTDSSLMFSGWGTGTSGLVLNRFGLSDMFFLVVLDGSCNIPSGRMGYDLVYRINGGAWTNCSAHHVAKDSAFENINLSMGVQIPGLSGSDTIQFGAKIDHSTGAAGPGIGELFLTVTALNG